MKILSIVITVLLSHYGFGQISNVQDVVAGAPLRTGSYDYVEGTPYFEGEEWKLGTITDLDGKMYPNVQIRFNAYDNELEYMRTGGAVIVRKGLISSFEINTTNASGEVESILFSTGFEVKDEVEKNDYVKVVYIGENYSIVQKVFKEMIKVTPASYGEQDYEKFIDNDSFYFISADQTEEIKLNKKNFYDIFPQHKTDIKEFIKKHGVNFSDLEEVKALARFIDVSLES